MGRSRAYTLVSWVLVALCAGGIFYLSSRTSTSLHANEDAVSSIWLWLCNSCRAVFGEDADVESVIGHGLEYAVLGLCLCNALSCHMPLRKAFPLAILLGLTYGLSDECHQLFVPGRAFQINDLVVDTVGAALGATVFRALWFGTGVGSAFQS